MAGLPFLALLLATHFSQEIRQALQARNYDRAESLLLEELKKSPDSAPVLVAIAGVQFQAGRYQRSIQLFEKADRIEPLDNANRFTLAMAYATLNQRDRARKHLLALPETAMTIYWQGRLDLADADYRSAIPRFERAIKLDATFMRAYDGLGLAHEAASNFTEAVKWYRIAISQNKDCSPWPAHNLGALLIKLERLDEAEPALKSSVSCASEFVPGHYQLGRLREKQGRPSEAIASFKSAIQRDAQHAEAWLALGRIYRRLGDTAAHRDAIAGLARLHQNNITNDPSALLRAIQTYRSVLQLDPSSADANYQLALLLTLRGEYLEALTQIRRLQPPQQERPQALAVSLVCHAALGRDETNLLLTALAGHKDFTEADVLGILSALAASRQDRISTLLLEKLQERGPLTSSGVAALASAYEKTGRNREARKTLEDLVSRSRVSPELLLQLARSAYQQKDYKGTLSYLAHARDLDPANAAIHFFFGMTAIAMDLPLEAKKALAEAVQLDSHNPYHHYAYGAVLAQERDASLSIPHFESYCRLRPDDVRGRFALAVAQFLSGQYEVAQASLSELVGNRETVAGAHYFLGRIAKQQNRLQDAERELTRSLALLSDQPDTRAELGQVYTRLRKHRLAEEQFQRVLQQDPNHYLANVNMLSLYQRVNHPEAATQAARVEQVKKIRTEKEQALWRTIEVRPY